jgi:RND family efflux transporter MFP subunit
MLAEQETVNVNPLSLKRPEEDEVVAPDEKQSEAVPASKVGGGRWMLIAAAILLAGGGWFLYAQVFASGKAASAKSVAEGGTAQQGKATLGFLAKDGAGGKDAKGSARVDTLPVEVVQRNETLRLTGNLMADEKASVASNVSGIAAEVCVDRGSCVNKGDVLVQIDATDAKNKLAEGQAMVQELKARLGLNDNNMAGFNPEDEPEVQLAKASYDLAEANLHRAKDLIARKVVSKESFDQTNTEKELAWQRYRQSKLLIQQAFATCQTAMAKLKILEKEVADTTIRAPFDGWVAEKLVSVGEQISSGMQATTVVTLVRINPLRLSLTVPQQSVGYVQLGQTVRFQVDSFPDRVFKAKVRYIAPVVTKDTRSMLVEAVVENPKGELYPGMFATAELESKKQKSVFLVPLKTVQKMGEVARVFVVRDGIAREQVVALGQEENGKVEILRPGLTGKEILVALPERVHDGDKVR